MASSGSFAAGFNGHIKLALPNLDELERVAPAAAKALSSEYRPGSGAISRLFQKMTPSLPAGKSLHYSLKAPEGAGTFGKAMHYVVQPALLGANVSSDIKEINEARKATPEQVMAMGLNRAEAEEVLRKARGATYGRAVGDAVSWGLYPASARHPLAHYGGVVGAGIAAPYAGSYLGKKFS